MQPDGKSTAVHMIDTTLRDGEQAVGVAFSLREKIALLGLLERAGVKELEVGTPAMGPSTRDEIRKLAALKPACLLTSWCRALARDLDLAAGCGTGGVNIGFPVSSILLESMGKTSEWVLQQLDALLAPARQRFQLVSVGAQDAFRANPQFLKTFVRKASACGAHRVRIADTVGLATPARVADMVCGLSRAAGQTQLEFHGHNDLGMATANTVAAIEAGIHAVSVTVNGLGERAGNAPLEQVVVAVNALGNRHCAVDPRKLMRICRFVARITDRPIPVDRPITGEGVFSHESGIHGAAVLKNPNSYQPFAPELLGRAGARLALGRHSGLGMIQHALAKAGITLTPEKSEQLLAAVRAEALQKRSVVSPNDLIRLYRNLPRH